MTWYDALVRMLRWEGIYSLALFTLLIFGMLVCHLAEWNIRKRKKSLFKLHTLMYKLEIRGGNYDHYGST